MVPDLSDRGERYGESLYSYPPSFMTDPVDLPYHTCEPRNKSMLRVVNRRSIYRSDLDLRSYPQYGACTPIRCAILSYIILWVYIVPAFGVGCFVVLAFVMTWSCGRTLGGVSRQYH